MNVLKLEISECFVSASLELHDESETHFKLLCINVLFLFNGNLRKDLEIIIYWGICHHFKTSVSLKIAIYLPLFLLTTYIFIDVSLRRN